MPSDERKELPLYQCHKQVRAAKITGMVDGGRTLVLGEYGTVTPGVVWLNKHQPAVGGFYVVYGDGYTSYSPASSFYAGYALADAAPAAKTTCAHGTPFNGYCGDCGGYPSALRHGAGQAVRVTHAPVRQHTPSCEAAMKTFGSSCGCGASIPVERVVAHHSA